MSRVVTPLEIGVCSTYKRSKIRSVIQVIEPLPPGADEAKEKAELRRRFGWKDVRGLTCYSATGTYRDLYVYFDYADKRSEINKVATKAFKCYGLDGAQVGKEWNHIRGSCVVVRAEPPVTRVGGMFQFFSSNVSSTPPSTSTTHDYDPTISIDEMVETLMFFKGKKASTVARSRDIERTQASMPLGFNPPNDARLAYVSPSTVRNPDQVARDREKCLQCHKPKGMMSKLMHCPCSKDVLYCSRECQKAHWKVHKVTCSVRKKK
mmetsp:Transcript_29278/g.39065  ORF Transcript_29278/g.39065 Transcript_29278/m.39065 type:complete len:264 (-) Transcript_29278:479-1270(-)